METVVQSRTVFVSLTHADVQTGTLLMRAMQQRDTQSWFYK
jgi:hypothetical protein